MWDLPVGAQGAGAGHGSGAGSLGRGGSGTGAGSSGNGSGAAAGSVPCGAVDFEKLSMQSDASGRAWVTVKIIVHFPDGRVESQPLDYPFFYPSERVNPFVSDGLPMLMQPPPPGKASGEPALVRYVIGHSNRAGFTLLPECPNAASNP